MSTIYLETIENFLSSELSVGFEAASLDAVDDLTHDQLRMFAQHWAEVDSGQHKLIVQLEPFRPDSEKVPRIDGPLVDQMKEIPPTSALFAHPYNGLTALDLDLVKRQALLFSRVAVIAPRLDFGGELHAMKSEFRTHLKSMLDLKPLVMDHTVELIPVSGFYSNEIEGGAGIVRSACQSDSSIVQWLDSQKDSLKEFSRTARQGDPFFDAGIRICSALAYGHTLAATHPFIGGLYKQLLAAEAPRQDRSRIAATQFLNKIDLPGFADLTWGDIKAVRDNEDCLARWRSDLNVAITSVDPDLPPDKFVERFDSQVQAQLTKAALDLNRDLASSSPLARFKKGGTSLMLSAVAATARVAFCGPTVIWAEIVNVFRKDGPNEALRLMWESKNHKGKRALRSHYAVFSPRQI
jgi:hypothetical protein